MKAAGRVLATMIAMVAILLIAVGADKGLNYLEKIKYEKECEELYAESHAQAEQLRTQDRDSLRRSWGEPDVMPSGIWADVWDLDADTTILVFYDAENDDKVERAALGQKGE